MSHRLGGLGPPGRCIGGLGGTVMEYAMLQLWSRALGVVNGDIRSLD